LYELASRIFFEETVELGLLDLELELLFLLVFDELELVLIGVDKSSFFSLIAEPEALWWKSSLTFDFVSGARAVIVEFLARENCDADRSGSFPVVEGPSVALRLCVVGELVMVPARPRGLTTSGCGAGSACFCIAAFANCSANTAALIVPGPGAES
jgi:hypothetical protein